MDDETRAALLALADVWEHSAANALGLYNNGLRNGYKGAAEELKKFVEGQKLVITIPPS